ncbi:hypothetical protein [Methylocapsa aurea]|uniref:hypothetical protein n=1 Tax=Methylocapsa aurea TaxID=663610 RepID=UPI003D18E330
MIERVAAEPAKKQHGGKRAGAGRKRGVISEVASLSGRSASSVRRDLKITRALSQEAHDWVKENWPWVNGHKVDSASRHALLLAAECPGAEMQIAALTWLREQRKAKLKVTIQDLVVHLREVGFSAYIRDDESL